MSLGQIQENDFDTDSIGDESFMNSFSDAASAASQSAPSNQPIAQPVSAGNGAAGLAQTANPQQISQPLNPQHSVPQPNVPNGNFAPNQPAPQATSVVNSQSAQTLSALGIQVPAGATDADLVRILSQEMQNRQAIYQYGQQLVPHYDRVQAILNPQQQPSHQAPSQAPQNPEQPARFDARSHLKSIWKAPEWQSDWDRMIQSGLISKDEDGAYRASPTLGVGGQNIADQINQAEAMKRANVQQMFQGNPVEFVYDSLEPVIENMIQSRVQEALSSYVSQQNVQQQAMALEQQAASWAYTRDALGRTVPTPQGQVMLSTIDNLRASGVNDPNVLLSVAQQMNAFAAQFQGAPQAQPTQPVQAPMQAPVAPQQQFAPQAQQFVPQQATPQALNDASRQSFLQNATQSAQQRALHTPMAGGYAAPGNTYQPENITEVDLNSMFVREFAGSRQ